MFDIKKTLFSCMNHGDVKVERFAFTQQRGEKRFKFIVAYTIVFVDGEAYFEIKQ